jgi:hypothetical protein
MSPFSIIGGVDNLMRKAKGVSNKPFGVCVWLSFLGILGSACLLL